QRYSKQIAGVISCYDRVVIQGILPGWCFDRGMTAFLNVNKIRIFDYPQFANALREEIRSHAEAITAENNIEIEFIRKIVPLYLINGSTGFWLSYRWLLPARRIGQCRRATRAPDGVLPGIERVTVISHPLILLCYPCQNPKR
ncbi:MAG: hypothetical protein PHS52_06655, partial [Desulfotomaculaceae bacterium]|nr:hypothetical protein [Desulfotomaculaceae bacterium]